MIEVFKMSFKVFPKRSIALFLQFLSSCSSFLFFFLYLGAFFVGQLLLSIISSRAWFSSISLQVIPAAFSSWRIFALCSVISKLSLSLMDLLLTLNFDKGHSGLQLSGFIHLPFPCFFTDFGRIHN